jgi:hypothetical protein
VLESHPPLISVPPTEFSQYDPSASIVQLNELLNAPISPELSIALELLVSAYGTNLRVVIRPEMFTHGVALAWLRDQVGETGTHLCLSDGETVRVLSGFTNQVFFYRIGRASCVPGILRLRRRAPELLAALGTQINTAVVVASSKGRRPRTTVLTPPATVSDPGVFLPFFASRAQLKRDIQVLAQQEPIALPLSQHLTYAAVSDSALQSIPFLSGLMNKIIESFTHPDRMLVIGAPLASEPEKALLPLLSAISRHAFTLPSGILPNVFLHVGGNSNLPNDVFGGQSRLVAYESDIFWRRGPTFYASFLRAVVLREKNSPHHRTGLGASLKTLTGRSWEEVTLPDADQIALARYCW